MSLVDTRFPNLDLFLQRWQRRLNVRSLGGDLLVGVIVAAPLAMVLCWFLPPSLRGLVASAAVLGVGIFGLVRARRLTKLQAASWLDQAGRTQGVFRAAAECLTQTNPTPSALQVLQAGESLALAPPSLRLPVRPIALRGLGALLMATAAVLGALFMGTARLGVPGTEAPPVASEASEAAPEIAGSSSPTEITPQEAARRLFPEDRRLAALAEQALTSGDPHALDQLLEQNSPDNAGRSGSAPGSSSRPPRPTPGSPGPSESGEPSGEPGGGSRVPGSGSSQGTPQPSSPDASDSTESAAPGSSPPGSLGNRPSPGASGSGSAGGSGEQGESAPGQGSAPGIGHSALPRNSTGRGGSTDQTLPAPAPLNPGLFEYVLPGTGPQLPSAQVLANSRRSAEAVISKTSPPPPIRKHHS